MRAGREVALLVFAAFLTGMLVTLVAYRFGEGKLGSLERNATLALILLLVAALFVLWWNLRGVKTDGDGELSMSSPERRDPTFQGSFGNPPGAGISRSSTGNRESGGIGARADKIVPAAGERQPSGMGSAQAQRGPIPSPAPRQFPEPSTEADPWREAYPPPTSKVDPSRLIDIWNVYYSKGDGKFNATGLRRQLENAGIDAEVIPGDRLGGGDNILAVDLLDHGGVLYLLPNFTKSPRAIEDWFRATDSGSRMARIQRLVSPATARKSGGSITLILKGEVE